MFGGAGLDLFLIQLKLVGDPPQEAWTRLGRYVSWMQAVEVVRGLNLNGATIEKLCLNSPAGGWFPALQEFTWHITRRNAPYGKLFFSPRLEKITIFPVWHQQDSDGYRKLVSSVASTFSTLPVPGGLQVLVIAALNNRIHDSLPWEYFKDSFSSVVLRLGPSLTNFNSVVPLSDEAVVHLISLPNLQTLELDTPPPHHSTLRLLVFPPLKLWSFAEGVVVKWFSTLELLEGDVTAAQDVTPLARVKASLRHLRVTGDGVAIDNALTSPIQVFQNLVRLDMDVYCYEDECSFELDDEDVGTLVMALPRLKTLVLGHPCPMDLCNTTVACLRTISMHCLELEELEIHFNTRQMAAHLEEMGMEEEEEEEEEERSQMCSLKSLGVHEMPLILAALEEEEVCDGLWNIFPSLERIVRAKDSESNWDAISGQMFPGRTHGEEQTEN